MKKIISVFLMVALVISCTIIASAEEITTDDKIQYLISHGVSEEFLENREESEINELYDSLYGEVFVFTDTQTVEMSESVDIPGISILGTIPESDMKLSITTVTYFDFDNSPSNKIKIKEVKVYVDYEWTAGKPMINKQDAISVNWDSGLFTFKANSFHASDYKQFGNAYNGWVEWLTYDNPAALNQGGLGYTVAMTSSLAGVTATYAQKGSAYFTLLPKQNIYCGTDKVSSINIEYMHDKNPFYGTVGFSYGGVGVTINFSGLNDSVATALNYRYQL